MAAGSQLICFGTSIDLPLPAPGTPAHKSTYSIPGTSTHVRVLRVGDTCTYLAGTRVRTGVIRDWHTVWPCLVSGLLHVGSDGDGSKAVIRARHCIALSWREKPLRHPSPGLE